MPYSRISTKGMQPITPLCGDWRKNRGNAYALTLPLDNIKKLHKKPCIATRNLRVYMGNGYALAISHTVREENYGTQF